ncbi:MAG: hypothetical protein Q9186_004923 [Xanthomendoza sp. 1 TL-2023]
MPLRLNNEENDALIDLSDKLIDQVVLWIAQKAPYQGGKKQKVNKYKKEVLQLALEIGKNGISISQGSTIRQNLLKTLTLAITLRSKAGEYEATKEKRERRHARCRKTEGAKKRSTKARRLTKRQQSMIKAMEKCLSILKATHHQQGPESEGNPLPNAKDIPCSSNRKTVEKEADDHRAENHDAADDSDGDDDGSDHESSDSDVSDHDYSEPESMDIQSNDE